MRCDIDLTLTCCINVEIPYVNCRHFSSFKTALQIKHTAGYAEQLFSNDVLQQWNDRWKGGGSWWELEQTLYSSILFTSNIHDEMQEINVSPVVDILFQWNGLIFCFLTNDGYNLPTFAVNCPYGTYKFIKTYIWGRILIYFTCWYFH